MKISFFEVTSPVISGGVAIFHFTSKEVRVCLISYIENIKENDKKN